MCRAYKLNGTARQWSSSAKTTGPDARGKSEIEVREKTPGLLIDRIHHHGCRGDVIRLLVSALQGIHEQACIQLLAMKATVNGETAKECGRP